MVRYLSPAWASLRESRIGVAFTVILTGSALALFGALQALWTGAPTLAAMGEASSLVRWTGEASPPSATQASAIHSLLQLLQAISWIGLVLAMVTVLLRYQVLAARRSGEVGVRRAVGASRLDILAALVTESGVIAVLALALGGAVATLLLSIARTQWDGGSLETSPLLLLGGAIVTATLVAGGLAPLRFLRDRYMRHPEPGSVPLGFPAFQLAASLALLLGSALLLERGRTAAAHSGESRASGIVVQLDSGVTEHSARAEAYGRLLAQLPGGSSLTAPGGLVGLGTVDNVTTDCGQCVRAGIYVPYSHTRAVHLFVSPDSFAARGARIVAGRALTPDDRWSAKRVAVVNRHLALRHFESGNAVGRKMWLGSDLRREPFEVVGIVEDSGSEALGGALQPRQAVYLSVLQLPPREADLLVPLTAPSDSARMLTAIEDTIGTAHIHSISAELDYLSLQSRPITWFGGWFLAGGLVILLTGSAGTMSTVKLWVDSLTTELALRRAVGASRRRIAAFVLIRTLAICGGGITLGLFLFFAVLRGALTAVTRDLPAWNVPTVLGAMALFSGICLVAGALPTMSLLRAPPATRLE